MIKKKLALCISLALSFVMMLCFAGCGNGNPGDQEPEKPQPEVKFNNPVIEKDMADPAVIRHDGWVYVFATGKKLYKSQDAITWQEVSGGVGINPTWGAKGAGFWAPDIVKIGDKFLLYYSLSVWGDENPGIGVASADHPEGPWTDHGKLFQSKEIGVENSIDPAVFVAQDGAVYMMWGSFRGIYGAELTADGLALKGGIDYAKEHKTLIAGQPGEWDGSTFEGAYVIYRNGYYYFFGSSGTCCDGLRSTYNVRVGRSQNPLGPYLDSNGKNLANNRNVGHQVLQGSGTMVGPGHNSILVDDHGNDYIVYHVYVDVDGEAKGRYLALDKLLWNDDGWCQVKNTMPSTRAVAPYFNQN